ncbi:hypothetical protein COBT_000365 [Conglomerata obtusa]
MNKNVVVDICCDQKDDFCILSKLWNCNLLHSDKITNSLTLSMRSDIENKDTNINEIIGLIKDNIDMRNQQNFNIFISEINIIGRKHKIQVKKLCYDEEKTCFKFKLLKELKVDRKFDFIYTLWPYSIDSEMLIDYNKHEINEYKNLDTKLFRCEKNNDINNIKITLSNVFGCYEYAFVRMIEKDEDKLVVRYIGMYRELGKRFKIWICEEYNFAMDGITYVSCN